MLHTRLKPIRAFPGIHGHCLILKMTNMSPKYTKTSALVSTPRCQRSLSRSSLYRNFQQTARWTMVRFCFCVLGCRGSCREWRAGRYLRVLSSNSSVYFRMNCVSWLWQLTINWSTHIPPYRHIFIKQYQQYEHGTMKIKLIMWFDSIFTFNGFTQSQGR